MSPSCVLALLCFCIFGVVACIDVGDPHFKVLESLRTFGLNVSQVLDVGAFIGEFASAARTTFPGSRVVLIEPNLHVETKRILLGPQDELIRVALGSTDSRSSLYFPAGSDTKTYTGATLLKQRFHGNLGAMPVVIRSLDSLMVERHYGAFQLINIDVEGAEMGVIRGGMTTLRRATFLLIEVTIITTQEGGVPAVQVLSFLDAELNFELFRVVHCHDLNAVWQIKCDMLLLNRREKHRFLPTVWGPMCHLVPSVDCGLLPL